jgi:hypothetical protein
MTLAGFHGWSTVMCKPNYGSIELIRIMHQYHQYSPSTTNTNLKPGNKRNFSTTVNLLRVLQKLTKNNSMRILSMVQWKSFAVLKRILRINNEDLHLYALKLLKSQIPYLGKKWRLSTLSSPDNTHIISQIFLNLRSRLRDETLAGDLEGDGFEAMSSNNVLCQEIDQYLEYFRTVLSKKAQTPKQGSFDDEFVDSISIGHYEDWINSELLGDALESATKAVWDPLQFSEPLVNAIPVSTIEFPDEDVSTFIADSNSDIDEFTEGWTDGMIIS